MKKLLVLILPLLVTGCVWSGEVNQSNNETQSAKDGLSYVCSASGGNWLEEFQECEDVTKDWCDQSSGEFNECAASCRHHSGDNIMCTLQCIPVCSFSQPEITDIKVNNLESKQRIDSPLVIKGEARGTWFFEGDFPIALEDKDGLIIAESYGVAEGEWMTEEFVPFTATIEFKRTKIYDEGTIVLKKDNPSGLPENEESLRIPILFE